MHRPTDQLQTGLVAGGLAVAGSFAAVGPTPDFVLAPISSAVVAFTPAQIITLSILLLGSLGSLLGFGLALAIGVGIYATVALATDWTADRIATDAVADLLAVAGATVGGLLLGVGLTGSLLSGGAAGAGLGLGLLVARRFVRGPTAVLGTQRRRFLASLAGVAGLGGLALLGGSLRSAGPQPTDAAIFDRNAADGTTHADVVAERLATADSMSLDVEGLPPLVSPIDEFYEVDINAIDPTVDAGSWSLSITGAVANPRTWRFEDLLDVDLEHRFLTLRCVGEPLNGHKMDTALWTGVPIATLLETVAPQGTHVMLRAADGYFEEFPIEALEGGFLAFGMNGESLPRDHGYPVRALIPGHWGEINVKWLTGIEVLTREMEGYWEKRGWHGTGPVNTVAKLWTVNHLEDGRVEVGGHAYAGTRGIESVEVSTDGRSTWTRATLGPALPGEDVWRQWRHVVDPGGEPVEVVVRAIDGTGSVQPGADAQPYPSGATGWVSETIKPE